MYKTIIKASLVFGALVIMLQSCVKFAGQQKAIINTTLTQHAIVQVLDLTIGSAGTFIYVDGAVTNGTALTYGNAFPLSTTGFTVLGGYREFLITGSGTQTPNSFAQNFQAGNSYTIFMYDTINKAKVITVKTNIVIPSDTTARVRFANFAFHPGLTPGIDIYSIKRGQFVATNLLYTQVTDFIPYASSLSDSLIVYENGNPAKILDTLAGFNPVRKRSYTLAFRGRYNINEAIIPPATTVPTQPRVLSVYANN